MTAKLLLLLIALSTPALSTPQDFRVLFPTQKQYIYEVQASLTSGARGVEEVSSSWVLTGRLMAQVVNESQVRFELDDIKVHVSSKNDGHISYEFDEEVKPLKLPWIVEYYKDLIESIYLPQEPTWISNFKRALSLNFQVKNGDGIYTSYEPCVHDYRCLVTYVSNSTYVKKYNSAPSSPKYGSSWVSVPWTDPVYRPDHTVWNSIPDTTTLQTEREYKLSDRTGLIGIHGEEYITYKIEDRTLQIFTEININYETEHQSASVEWPELTRSTPQHDKNSCVEPTCGIQGHSQGYLKNRTYEILLKIAKKGIDADNIVRNSSIIHSLDFIDLLNTMSQLNYTTLLKLFDDLVLGTSYELETARNIFLEVLPYSGSKDSVKFVKYLVTEEKEKIEDSTLLTLIRKLPFTGANYTQELLQKLEAFTKLGLDFPQEIRHAAILSFSTLLHQTKREGKLGDDYFDNMVVKYVRMYSDCPHYMDRLIWLQGLCNIGFWAQKYTMEIFTDTTKRRNERLWAAFSTNYIDNQYYTDGQIRVIDLLLPTLANSTEDVQIKMAAIHVFLTSTTITQNDFLLVYRHIVGDQRLMRFWYMAIKSLQSNKNFDGYKLAAMYVPTLSSLEYSLVPNHWASNNLVVSSSDQASSLHLITTADEADLPTFAALRVSVGGRRVSLNYWASNSLVVSSSDQASSLHLITTADEADLPTFAALRVSVGGRRVSVYVVAEGIASNIYKRMHNFNEDDLKIETLVELLKEFRAFAVKPAEEVLVDFVVKINEKAVFVSHMNQTRFESWNLLELAKSVNEFLRLGSHINQQMVYYPSHKELIFPNELGIPVRLQTTTVSFTSIRGNLTTPSTDLHIRYQGVSLTSLSTFGALIQSEHSVRVQTSTVAHLPIRFNLTAAPGGVVNFISPNLQRGGVVMHTRTHVEKRVNGSSDSYTVTAKDLDPSKKEYEVNESSIYFDCDKSSDGLDAEDYFKSNFYNFLNTLRPSRVLFNSVPFLLSPPYRRCGVIYPPKTLGEDRGLLATLVVDEAPVVAGFVSGKQKELNVSMLVKYYRQFTDESEDETIFLLDSELILRNMIEKSIAQLAINGSWPETPGTDWGLVIRNEDSYEFPKRIPISGMDYKGSFGISYRNLGNLKDSEGQISVLYNGTAVDTSRSKRIDFSVTYTDLPQDLLLKSLQCLSETYKKSLKLNNSTVSKFNASLKVKNGVASISVDELSKIQFESLGFDWLFDMWTNWKIYNYGLYRECRLSHLSSSVSTLDCPVEKAESTSVGPLKCAHRIALADCTRVPRFAVIREKEGGLRVYAGGYYVTLGREEGKIAVNETQSGGHLNVTVIQDGVKVSSQLSGVQVLYKQYDTSILVPNSHLHAVCGECTGEEYDDCFGE